MARLFLGSSAVAGRNRNSAVRLLVAPVPRIFSGDLPTTARRPLQARKGEARPLAHIAGVGAGTLKRTSRPTTSKAALSTTSDDGPLDAVEDRRRHFIDGASAAHMLECALELARHGALGALVSLDLAGQADLGDDGDDAGDADMHNVDATADVVADGLLDGTERGDAVEREIDAEARRREDADAHDRTPPSRSEDLSEQFSVIANGTADAVAELAREVGLPAGSVGRLACVVLFKVILFCAIVILNVN